MSKIRSKAYSILAMTAAMSNEGSMMFTGSGKDNLRSIPKEPIPPKGAKEYFFNEDGEFSTEQMLKAETVFKCHAINDKNAIRKFKCWQRES